MTFSGSNVGVNIAPTAKFHINNTSSFNSFLVEDSTNPDSTPFVVDATGNVAVGTGSASNKFIVSNGTNDVFTVNTTNSTVWARGAGNVSSNTSFGENALDSNTTGTSNTAFGQNALTTVTTGSNNSAFGRAALQSSNGNENGGFGVSSLIFLSSGNSNVGLGFQSGIYITDGVTQLTNAGSSIFIGANTKALANNQTNQIVIGHNTTGNGSNSVTLGNDSITKTILQGNVGINTTTPSEKLHVDGNALITGTTLTGNLIVTGSTQSIFSGNSSSDLVRITQTGSGNAFVVEDSANPDSSPFVIDNSGNVGIGLTNPVYKLDVSGDTNFKGDVLVSGNLTYNGNLFVTGATIVQSGLTVSEGLVLVTQPTSGYTTTQILMRNSTTGQVEITDRTSPSIYNYGMTYVMSTFNYLT
jgi:hypothetical protein